MGSELQEEDCHVLFSSSLKVTTRCVVANGGSLIIESTLLFSSPNKSFVWFSLVFLFGWTAHSMASGLFAGNIEEIIDFVSAEKSPLLKQTDFFSVSSSPLSSLSCFSKKCSSRSCCQWPVCDGMITGPEAEEDDKLEKECVFFI